MTIAAAPIAPADPQKIELILGQLSTLPTLAPIAVRLLSLTGRANAEVREIARLIESDASLTAQILSLSRRASHGLARDNLTIERAVVLLGFRTIRQVVLATKMIELFPPGPSGATNGFDRAGFWTHCLAVACASRRLATTRRPGAPACDPEDAFLGGLLHDLGKIALATCIPKSYDRVLIDTQRGRIDILSAERAAIGTDHTVAGRRLAQRWKLPDELADCIWLHHLPPDALPDPIRRAGLVPTVWLADVIVRRQRLGFSGNPPADIPLGEAAQRAGIDLAIVEDAVKSLPDEIEERAAWVGLSDLRSGPVYAEALAASAQELSRLHDEIREQTSRVARQSAYLGAIAKFNGCTDPGTSVGDACAAAADCISRALDVPAAVVYLRPDGAGPVTLGRAGDRSRHDTWSTVAANADSGPRDEAAAADLTPSGIWIAAAPAGIADLIDASRSTLGPGPIWFLPLLCERQPVGGALVSADPERAGLWRQESTQLEALSTALGRALAAATAQAKSSALGENLVWAQQRLAAAQSEIAAARGLRMTAEMAAGAAHELNNPLALISGRAQLLRTRAAREDDRRALDEIVDAAHRASDIITDLVSFAEPARPHLQCVPIAPLLHDLIDKSARPAAAGRAIDVSIPDRLPPAHCDPAHLRDALIELIRNALQFAPHEGGRLQIKARHDPADEFLVIAVVDNGPGMSPDVRERAFDPFFSAHPAGRQRGMGLARALRWMQANGGTITLEAAPGGGTIASLHLPRAVSSA